MLEVPDRFRFEDRLMKTMPVHWAWTGLSAWVSAGLLVLVARIRRVEVVT
jgi:hypothetical protein